MKTLTFIPVVFVILTLYLTSVELHSMRGRLKSRSLSGEPKSQSSGKEPKSHSSGKEPKSNSSGKEPKSNSSGKEPNSHSSGKEPKSNSSGNEPNSHSSGKEPKSHSSGNEPNSHTSGKEPNSHSSGKEPKSHSSGKEPKGKICLDSCQCPNGTACLPAGNGEGSGNSTKKCQPCGCRSVTQCRKSWKEVFCDCSNSGYTGSNCETEIEPTTTTTTTTTTSTTPQPPTCLEGWLGFGSHCYKYFSTHVDWDTAKANCESLNAYLVEITSEDEEDFIDVELYSSPVWIALSDVDTEGTFVWAYSGAINSNNFQNGYTEYNNAAYDCVNLELFGTFTWLTSDCARKIGYICERPL
ncbi:brevican core protein-like [Ruditapes philippinarum]|uniref:brevican core protein-like n=1 Tax=Ruditapes philippinarum TaxID=129788 RepID=UPI00295B4C84|nr:brevican core protein-like [Ruditapes philippinarum]